MDTAELSRLLANLVRLGTIAAVDHARALCRVESGGLLTGWLPWVERRAGATRTWDPPTVGEQVIVLAPSGEMAAAVVVTGLYRAAHPAPDDQSATHVITYPDGARIVYDHASGALTATGIQTAHIEAAVSVTLDTPLVHCTQDLHVAGKATIDDLLSYGNGIAGAGGDNGNQVTGDFIHTDGILSSEGTVLHTHTHPGDSGGTTGAPN
ncbi:MAG: phage baseplate assembly protein V [Pseudomonadota bacterium]